MSSDKVFGPTVCNSNSTNTILMGRLVWELSHRDCCFEFQDQSRDAKVIQGQSEDSQIVFKWSVLLIQLFIEIPLFF